MITRDNRIHAGLATLTLLITAGLTGVALWSSYLIGTAHAAAAAGSGAVAAAPIAAQAAFSDPSSNAVGFVTDVINLWHTAGWPAALLLLVVGAAELAAFFGRNNPTFAWLGKGRVSLALGGLVAVGAAALNSLIGGGTWSAVLGAAVTAGLAWWHQAGVDPGKA